MREIQGVINMAKIIRVVTIVFLGFFCIFLGVGIGTDQGSFSSVVSILVGLSSFGLAAYVYYKKP